MSDDQLPVVPQTAPAPAAQPVFNPLDAEPVAFAQALAKRSENYDQLAMHLRAVLVPKKDFGRIHVSKNCENKYRCTFQAMPGHWSEPSLFAAGADKILGLLGLACHYPGETALIDAAIAGTKLEEIILRCEIVDAHGQTISEGHGACARREVNGSLNNAVKRAEKRARVGAVMRLPSISALFEPDFLEQVEREAPKRGNNGTQARAQRSHMGRYNTGAELQVMPFGRHKDQPFDELPDDYLDWILTSEKMRNCPDVLEAAKRENRRRIGQANAPG